MVKNKISYNFLYLALLNASTNHKVLLKGTAQKVFKYGVYSGPYFPVFGLNTDMYSVNLRFQSEYRKYLPEKTPYLDTFHAVGFHNIVRDIALQCKEFGLKYLVELRQGTKEFKSIKMMFVHGLQ